MEKGYSNRGGWFAERLQTGALFGVKGLLAAGTVGLLVSTGTGAHIDALAQMQQQRLGQSLTSSPTIAYVSETRNVRSPSEDLKRIKEVINPAISDLAKCFQVSRQSIYNWLNGEQPSSGHLAMLKDLALAADALSESGATITGYVLKRKFIEGKNLFEAIQHGGSACDYAKSMIRALSHEEMQRGLLSPRFSRRTSLKDFSDPGIMQSNDKA